MQHVQELIEIAGRGLKRSFDENTGLFYHKLKQSGDDLVPEGISVRYSAMALIGLYQAQACGNDWGIDTNRVITELIRRLDAIDNLGELGLLLWVDALGERKYLDSIFERIEAWGDVSAERGKEIYPTMPLAWLIAGLSYAHPHLKQRQAVERVLDRVYTQLIDNFNSETSLFRSSNLVKRKNLIASQVAYNTSSFANQIYPIHGLALYAKLTQNDDAKKMATACAQKLCALQGPQGQWWWIYNVNTGQVAEKYPVYSVHQDSMAPMGLLHLSYVTGLNFEKELSNGLEWMFCKNELQTSLVDSRYGAIWRAIQRRGSLADGPFGMGRLGHFNKKASALGLGGLGRVPSKLEMLHEMRSYHLGWILYAWCPYVGQGDTGTRSRGAEETD